jgi:NAD(P)H-hydrate repair Nnr-like enzyme with NAD(P)H-hydrate dehydratase domain
VLAGIIAGLLARTRGAEEVHGVVEAADWLHVEAARAFGPGLIAEDLPEALPTVFRELGL